MLGDVVKLQTAQDAACFAGLEGVIKRCSSVRRKVVQHDPNAFGLRIVPVNQVLNLVRELARGQLVGYCRMTPAGVNVVVD